MSPTGRPKGESRRAQHGGSSAQSRSQGFTLVELMVTIALLGTLLALAAPAFGDWIRGARVRTIADALQTGARLAQAEAVRFNRQVVFFLTNDSTCSAATAAAANGNFWAIRTIGLTAGDPVRTVQCGTLADSAPGVSISGPTAICFNSAGRQTINAAPGAGGATCVLPPTGRSIYDVTASGARPLRVQISLGGQVRQCDPARTLSAAAPDGC
ncbi:MAG: GspH/FimT family pseudopilin [Rubrivivax sp.]